MTGVACDGDNVMKLYYAPGTCAVACWIALEWAGARFEPIRADYASEAFRRVNPLAMVPALDFGAERAMTQANAILQYVVTLHPEARLGADRDGHGVFEFSETLAFLTGDFHPAFWPWFTPERFTLDHAAPALEQVRTAAHVRIGRVMSHLDGLIGDGVHVYRNRRSVADAYAYVMVRWTARLPKPWQDYPNVARFMDHMDHDPVVEDIMTQAGSK